MEFDNDNQVLEWIIVHIFKIKNLLEELAQEGQPFFEDNSLTLHNIRNNKEARKV